MRYIQIFANTNLALSRQNISLQITCKDHLIENQEMFKENNKSKKERGKNGSR